MMLRILLIVIRGRTDFKDMKEQRVESQVNTLEPNRHVSDIQGISMDVGPLVEKPVGVDIEIHFDYETDL